MADIRINSLPSTATSFNTDDYIAIDGASGGTRKMLAATLPLTDVTLGGSSGPSVKSSLSARAARQGLVFDGSAGATATISALGTAPFTVSAVFSAKSLAANNVIIDYNTVGYSILIYVKPTGILTIYDRAANVALYNSNTGVIEVNKIYHIAYSRGVGVFVNGVNISGSFADGSNYTDTVYRIGWAASSDSFCTGFLSILIYNRALSASEVVALYEAGAPAGADYNSASNTSLITGDNSTFASDTGYWTKSSATISGGNLNLSSDGSSIFRANLLVIGKKYRYVTSVSANTTSVLIGSGSGAGYGTVTTTGTITGEFTATSTTFVIYQSGAGAATVGDITLFSLGLLLAPDAAQAGGGLVWYDTSGNAANISWTSGVSWNVPSSSYWGGQLKLQSTTGTNGLRINNISSDTFGFFGGGNDGLPVFSSLNNATIGSATYGWLAFNSSVTGDFELYRRNNSTTNTAALIVTRSTGNLLIGGTTDGGQKLQVSGTIRSGSGSGETLSAGSIDVGADIGIASTQGIVQGGARIVTFTSGNATFAGTVTAPQFKSATGSVSATNGNATTLFSLSGVSNRMLMVHAYINVDDAANYAAYATIVMDGTSARIVSNNASLMTITLSGSNVQATQNSGITQSILWKYTSV